MRTTSLAFVAATMLSLAVTPMSAAVAEGGNMNLMPSEQWAKAVPDGELDKLRGGFTGVQFSVEFVAIVNNQQGNVTGIPGASGSLPAGSTVNVSDGNLQVHTLVSFGSGGSFNGIGIVNVIPGNFNVVDFQLNLNVNIVTVANAASLPQLGAILGRQ